MIKHANSTLYIGDNPPLPKNYRLFYLQNRQGSEVLISELGATIPAIKTPDINAQYYTPTDEVQIPTGEIPSVD